MPPMHVAFATPLAIAGWRLNRVSGLLLTGYALVIWIGSIHFGWHYCVDGLVAATLMLGIWSLSRLLARPFYGIGEQDDSAARSVEQDDRAGDLPSLHLLERLVDVAKPDATRDHLVQPELARLVERHQARDVDREMV
ncbi:hypothetical protein HMF7854_09940 [Sphingomonas ginkgonis]|uniref:Inositolphosphotransferase Aur1/Ipt1 domain-containing protein n=1 Tax=Sphingomonas ginkgonis TaxID=2315330 RepID=A0A3S0EMS0_9SPHN|nr:hypothetical protein HMF7854_09940 [Sphingomonas ginkgonis]